MIDYMAMIGKGVKRGRGRPPGPRPSKARLVRLYVKERHSLRETADALHISKDIIARALAEYGIARRSATRRSRLADFSMRELRAGIREQGLRGFSRTLGVDPGTITYHIRSRERKR